MAAHFNKYLLGNPCSHFSYTHTAVDDVVVDAREQWQDIEQGVHIFLAGEKLKVGLLVHVATRHAPAHHWVLAADTINIGLEGKTQR